MNRNALLLLVPFSSFLMACLPCAVDAGEVRFNEHIRPILAEHCWQCHGPDAAQRQGDLRLDLEEAAKGRAIEPGKPFNSSLYQRITAKEMDQCMPPPETGKQLNMTQIELIRVWIQQGAKFEGHWAYESIRTPPIPPNESSGWSDIDRFLLHRLTNQGLTFSPEVSRQAWIRRATLDLIGIPPTWEEVTHFEQDLADDAYEKVIDRLLDSPGYGQRWGRYWLDIARYADTHGGSAIGFTQFPFSYTYRDYVVQAFNNDTPYHQFITEQLAADQMGLADNSPALAALGFLTVGMQYRNRHDVIDDQIDVISRGLQGLTVACARCHDHKFDAIPTKDYYAMYAALAGSQSPETLPIIDPQHGLKSVEEYEHKLKQAERERDDLERDQTEIMRGRLRMQIGIYLREIAKGAPEQDTSTAFLSYRTDDLRPFILNRWRHYLSNMSPQDSVFGPWVQFAQLPEQDFGSRVSSIRDTLGKENGEPVKPGEMKSLSKAAPRWNPIVLQAIASKQPQSMLDVADMYGEIFRNVHQEWHQSILQTSLEAVSEDRVVPDEDEKHLEINSPILRQLRHHLYAPETPTAVPDQIASSLLNRTVSDALGGKRSAIHQLHLTAEGSPPRAMVLAENSTVEDYFVLRRGNPLDRGEKVQPHFLTAIANDRPPTFQHGKRRLGLAQALIAPENPLTRRVIVNWIWQQHFGLGLVRTPDDFGSRGRPPMHPELLDYLASTFLADGWSIKRMHRRIMLSKAYRQASIENELSRSKDPENELFWRMPRRRLDLEAMRDSLLAVSSELDSSMGGRPIDLLASPSVPRRSVYGLINRDIVSNFASTFDAANPNSCTAKRSDTTVPQQTLFALNSDFIQDRATRLAAMAIHLGPDEEARVRWLYQRVFSRNPDAEEVQLALRYISLDQPAPAHEGSQTTSAWQRFAHVLLASNEFVFVD